MERLRLNGSVRRDFKSTCIRRYREAISAFNPSAKALTIELCGELIAESEAIGREPVIREGNGRGNVGRPKIALSIDTELESVAATPTETLRQAPVDTAAGEREARQRIRRKMVVHAAGETIVASADVIGADGRVAGGIAAATETRSPCCPSLLERLHRLCFEHRGICERYVGRKTGLSFGRKTGRLSSTVSTTERWIPRIGTTAIAAT